MDLAHAGILFVTGLAKFHIFGVNASGRNRYFPEKTGKNFSIKNVKIIRKLFYNLSIETMFLI